MSRIKWAKAKSRLIYQFVDWPDTWPARLSPAHLARLQAASEPESGRVWHDEIKALRSAIDAAADAGEIPHVIETFRFAPSGYSYPMFGSAEQQKQARLDACYSKELPAITASNFTQWLSVQGETPSVHIAAWVQSTARATARATTPAPVAQPIAREQRQDRRLKACEVAGLVMPKSSIGRLPDGVGNVADLEGVTRQTFSTDVKAALKRRESARREGRTVHRA